MARTSPRERLAGVGFCFSAALLWSLPPVVMRYLSNALDPYSMNFYRYTCGAVFISTVVLLRRPGALARLRPYWKGVLLVAFPNIIHQTAWAASIALRYVPPAFSAILERATVPMSVILSFIFLADERRVIRRPIYLAGLSVALLGMVGLAFSPEVGGEIRSSLGIFLVLLAAMTWAWYLLQVKISLERLDSATAFCGVSVVTAAALGVICFAWGEPRRMLAISAFDHFVLVSTGIACIGVAHTIYYVAQKRLGIAAAVVTYLISPLLTAIWSRWWFGEQFTFIDAGFGLMLLSGSTVIFYTRDKISAPVAE